jgi:uncharacterized protein YycO
MPFYLETNMKTLTALLAAFVICSTASAQNVPAQPAAEQPAQTENAPAMATAAASAAPAAGDNKLCQMMHGHTCHLRDKSLELGAHCMCGDHPGTVGTQ